MPLPLRGRCAAKPSNKQMQQGAGRCACEPCTRGMCGAATLQAALPLSSLSCLSSDDAMSSNAMRDVRFC
eukprot:COSAG04_NODE_3458_length_2797_cov_2.125278_4_plen_69_part_01